jgi:hypothetical protein
MTNNLEMSAITPKGKSDENGNGYRDQPNRDAQE